MNKRPQPEWTKRCEKTMEMSEIRGQFIDKYTRNLTHEEYDDAVMALRRMCQLYHERECLKERERKDIKKVLDVKWEYEIESGGNTFAGEVLAPNELAARILVFSKYDDDGEIVLLTTKNH